MSTPSAARMLRQANRTVSRTLTRQYQTRTLLPAITLRPAAPAAISRRFSISYPRTAGLMPDAEEPKAPEPEPDAHEITSPANVSEDEFHVHANRYMESLNEKAEALQDSRQDVEVEFSAGVMTITLPSPSGTYVINKQPPNKQIWFASPISGPKRFDWVVAGEGMHEKEGGGAGDWVYVRDGTSLTDLLRRELGISVDIDGDAEALVKPSVEPIE
ncbi:hypothetical protein LTR08_000374 [Meristemomyces frigidus]|nr:hypothetical protein LTR08_000374 [Meristemomyces frigidus]